MADKRREIRKVLTVVNSQKSDVGSVVRVIEEFARARGIAVASLDYSDHPPQEALADVDLAISLGGDGTLLSCARMLAPRGIPILAVNIGDFGFITEVSRHELVETWEKLLAGQLGVSERLMLSVTVQREGAPVASFVGLNETV
ncbi:MAG TPA: NAD(+)/NADH kinase, partial [Spirochaetia bacterium]|nr:NAD(+)/NADH kinase [Spirochaetia bacterium]